MPSPGPALAAPGATTSVYIDGGHIMRSVSDLHDAFELGLLSDKEGVDRLQVFVDNLPVFGP
jgi:hypothetical protein